jgi:hypothetical protein
MLYTYHNYKHDNGYILWSLSYIQPECVLVETKHKWIQKHDY